MNTGIGSPFFGRAIKSIISFHSVTQFNVDGLQESNTTNAAKEFLKNDWVRKTKASSKKHLCRCHCHTHSIK